MKCFFRTFIDNSIIIHYTSGNDNDKITKQCAQTKSNL